MSSLLCDLVFGGHGRSQLLETSQAPSFCRAEGAFPSGKDPRYVFVIFLLLNVVFLFTRITNCLNIKRILSLLR